MLNVELCHTFIKKLHLYRIEQNLIQAPKDFWIFEHLRRLGFCTYPHIVLKLKITQDHPPPPTPFLSKLEFHLLLLSLVTGESMGLISAISVSGESAESHTSGWVLGWSKSAFLALCDRGLETTARLWKRSLSSAVYLNRDYSAFSFALLNSLRNLWYSKS